MNFFYRIDDRIIHGQVTAIWMRRHNCKRVVVVDNDTANNDIAKTVYSLCLPSGIEAEYCRVENAPENLKNLSGKENIMVIVRNPSVIVALRKSGVEIEDVVVGNTRSRDWVKQINSSILLNSEDINSFKELDRLGVRCCVQRVPGEPPVEIKEIL